MVNNGLFGEDWQKDNFRMTQDIPSKCFAVTIHSYLVKKFTSFRNPVSIE